MRDWTALGLILLLLKMGSMIMKTRRHKMIHIMSRIEAWMRINQSRNQEKYLKVFGYCPSNRSYILSCKAGAAPVREPCLRRDGPLCCLKTRWPHISTSSWWSLGQAGPLLLSHPLWVPLTAWPPALDLTQGLVGRLAGGQQTTRLLLSGCLMSQSSGSSAFWWVDLPDNIMQ